MEAVGVVLGALPLAVEALKGYRTALSSLRNVDRDLKAIIQDLETEQIRLRTTCEVLLDGVVPQSMIDAFIETPFGSNWRPYNDELRLRLWGSHEKVEIQILDMQEAVRELKEKLCINDNGRVGYFTLLNVSY